VGAIRDLVELLEEDAETACVVGREERVGEALGRHAGDVCWRERMGVRVRVRGLAVVGCVWCEGAVKVEDKRIRHRSRHSRAKGADHSRRWKVEYVV
jgi:hypothetical protein